VSEWLRAAWEFSLQSFRGLTGHRQVYRTRVVNEIPHHLQPNSLYVIGVRFPWSAALQCPCGCGAIIQLSLLSDDFPHWLLVVDRDGIPTLSPSVWRTTGCGSHFLLKKGIVIWCRRRAFRSPEVARDSPQ
jgi:Family of unknown function (DUF6527)